MGKIIMGKITKELYDEAALSAYENSLDLLQEAEILHSSFKYARTYALCVLAAEEFSKSFLYKCQSVGLISDKGFMEDLRKHDEKIFHGVHLLISVYHMANYGREIREAISHDKSEMDHSKHLTRMALRDSFVKLMKNENIIKIFKAASTWKTYSFYVDIQDSRVLIPSERISAEMAKEILDILKSYLPGFEIILGSDDDRFKEIVKHVDPQIYSGSMKSR